MAGLIAPTPLIEPLVASNPPYPGFLVQVPLAVRAAAPTLADGTALAPGALTVAGCLLLRRAAAFTAADVWDASQLTWLPDLSPQGQAAMPLPMSFHAGQPRPWLGVFANVPSAGGGAMLQAASTGFPVYFARTVFQTRRGGLSGRSGDSAPVVLDDAAEKTRPRLELVPDNPMSATTLILRLRGAGNLEVGSLRISDGGAGTLELKTAGGARVTLTSAGDVELVPGPGRRVVVHRQLVGHTLGNPDQVLYP